jgi:hypothetical protein
MQGNTGNRGGAVLASGRQWALVAQKAIETSLFQRIAGADWKKALANLWSRQKITKYHQKGPALVVGQKPNGKSQLTTQPGPVVPWRMTPRATATALNWFHVFLLVNLTLNKRMQTPLRLAVLLSLGLTACRAPKASKATNVNVVTPSQPQPAAPVIDRPSPQSTAKAESLDVNDISFLWPVPKTKADADALISLADAASDGPIMPPAIFKALIETAKTVNVDGVAIQFPDGSFEDPKTWKVAGIRVNPTALGTNPKALAAAEVPGIRLIVQPVTISGEVAVVHDFAAHVVFNYIVPGTPPQQAAPDKAAFGAIVQDLRALKKSLALPTPPGGTPLQVHPGFSPDPKPLTDKLRELLKKHLASSQLDRQQAAAISFMGVPGGFEPWIFFKVEVDTKMGVLTRKPVSGVFDSANPESQMLSFRSDPNGQVKPAPQLPKTVTDVSTARLFPTVANTEFDNALFPDSTNAVLQHFKLRDVVDIVANPQIATTLSTDCLSCHTESTRRNAMGNVMSQLGTAFKPAAGISGVTQEVLPKDRWNLRNFGWGFNFTGGPGFPQGFQPTVSQRAANEAAESADYINKNYPPSTQ